MKTTKQVSVPVQSGRTLQVTQEKTHVIQLLLVSGRNDITERLQHSIAPHEDYKLTIISTPKNIDETIKKINPTTIFWDDEIENKPTTRLVNSLVTKFPDITMVAYCKSSPHRDELQENGCGEAVDPLDLDTFSQNVFNVITV